MTIGPLHTRTSLGALKLPNRIIMAPLTRSRSAYPGNLQTPMHAAYYMQRSSAGLIVCGPACKRDPVSGVIGV